MRAAVLGLLALGLAGCEGLSVAPPEETQTAPSEEAAEVAADDPGREVAARAEIEAREPESGSLPPLPAPRPEVPRIDPESLTGLTLREAQSQLGPPDESSEEPPATVWTYIIGPCRLELFFYYDLESQQQRALAYDLRPGSDAEGARSLCLVELGRRGEDVLRPGPVEAPAHAERRVGAPMSGGTRGSKKEVDGLE